LLYHSSALVALQGSTKQQQQFFSKKLFRTKKNKNQSMEEKLTKFQQKKEKNRILFTGTR
jgi:hypothetical protein